VVVRLSQLRVVSKLPILPLGVLAAVALGSGGAALHYGTQGPQVAPTEDPSSPTPRPAAHPAPRPTLVPALLPGSPAPGPVTPAPLPSVPAGGAALLPVASTAPSGSPGGPVTGDGVLHETYGPGATVTPLPPPPVVTPSDTSSPETTATPDTSQSPQPSSSATAAP
jgi:hypothetical protein